MLTRLLQSVSARECFGQRGASPDIRPPLPPLILHDPSGAMVLAYSTEQTKGKMFALFWAIFVSPSRTLLPSLDLRRCPRQNLGAVLGNAIDLGLVYDSTANTVSNSTYAAFVAISGCGAFIPFLLVNNAPARSRRVNADACES